MVMGAALLGAAGGCDDAGETAALAGAAYEPAEARPIAAPPEEPSALVGEACFTSKQCAEEEYCATAPGECGREGVCTPVPSECDRTRALVCSCEGVDYINSCHAAASKDNVDFAGRCPPPACTSNAECASNSYCAKATGDCGGTGTCQLKAVSCSGAWAPVCGCNDKTYANACKAASVGVVVKKLGAC